MTRAWRHGSVPVPWSPGPHRPAPTRGRRTTERLTALTVTPAPSGVSGVQCLSGSTFMARRLPPSSPNTAIYLDAHPAHAQCPGRRAGWRCGGALPSDGWQSLARPPGLTRRSHPRQGKSSHTRAASKPSRNTARPYSGCDPARTRAGLCLGHLVRAGCHPLLCLCDDSMDASRQRTCRLLPSCPTPQASQNETADHPPGSLPVQRSTANRSCFRPRSTPTATWGASRACRRVPPG